jgi:hypothetical protein
MGKKDRQKVFKLSAYLFMVDFLILLVKREEGKGAVRWYSHLPHERISQFCDLSCCYSEAEPKMLSTVTSPLHLAPQKGGRP